MSVTVLATAFATFTADYESPVQSPVCPGPRGGSPLQGARAFNWPSRDFPVNSEVTWTAKTPPVHISGSTAGDQGFRLDPPGEHTPFSHTVRL